MVVLFLIMACEESRKEQGKLMKLSLITTQNQQAIRDDIVLNKKNVLIKNTGTK